MFPTYLSGGEPSALGAEALADTDRAADKAAEAEEDGYPLGGSDSSIEIEAGARSEITVVMVSAVPPWVTSLVRGDDKMGGLDRVVKHEDEG